MNEKGFFTKSQTSEYSGIAERTLDAARARGDLPATLVPPDAYPELLDMSRLLSHPSARTLLMKRK